MRFQCRQRHLLTVIGTSKAASSELDHLQGYPDDPEISFGTMGSSDGNVLALDVHPFLPPPPKSQKIMVSSVDVESVRKSCN